MGRFPSCFPVHPWEVQWYRSLRAQQGVHSRKRDKYLMWGRALCTFLMCHLSKDEKKFGYFSTLCPWGVFLSSSPANTMLLIKANLEHFLNTSLGKENNALDPQLEVFSA